MLMWVFSRLIIYSRLTLFFFHVLGRVVDPREASRTRLREGVISLHKNPFDVNHLQYYAQTGEDERLDIL